MKCKYNEFNIDTIIMNNVLIPINITRCIQMHILTACVVQLAEEPYTQAEGHGFEPRQDH